MKRKTILFIAGLLIMNILSSAPSPILSVLKESFGVRSDAIANFMVSVTYPAVMITSLLGGKLLQRVKSETAFLIALLLSASGMLFNYIAKTYVLFILGRVIFSVGIGLTYPLLGNVILEWYSDGKRRWINTLESMLPFLGSLVSYSLISPLYYHLGSWESSQGIWGFISLAIAALWVCSGCMSSKLREGSPESELSVEGGSKEPLLSVYSRLIQIREIRQLTLVYVCDFFSCSYIIAILPTLLSAMNSAITQNMAGFISAALYPGFGIVGSLLGGYFLKRGYSSYGLSTFAQGLKVVSLLLCCVPNTWCTALGFACFGFGNSFWMPSFYMIPVKRLRSDSYALSSTYGMMIAVGMLAGSISPTVGGWITDLFTAGAFAHMGQSYIGGLRISLACFNVVNIISLLLAVSMQRNERSRPAEPEKS